GRVQDRAGAHRHRQAPEAQAPRTVLGGPATPGALTPARRARRSAHEFDEAVEQGDLTLDELRAGGRRVEPLEAIDLGERRELAGPGRPLDLERVARRRRRVEVALDRPRPDHLARLADLAEIDRLAVGQRVAELLL